MMMKENYRDLGRKYKEKILIFHIKYILQPSNFLTLNLIFSPNVRELIFFFLILY